MKLKAGDKVLSPSGDLFEIVCLYRGLADVRPLKGAIKKAIASNGDIAELAVNCNFVMTVSVEQLKKAEENI